MEDSAVTRITQLLTAAEGGDSLARDRLWAAVYDEVRSLARDRLAQESPLGRRDATTLAHEAYRRLQGPDGNAHWNSRAHFFSAVAEALRRICVDDARKRMAFVWRNLSSPRTQPTAARSRSSGGKTADRTNRRAASKHTTRATCYTRSGSPKSVRMTSCLTSTGAFTHMSSLSSILRRFVMCLPSHPATNS